MLPPQADLHRAIAELLLHSGPVQGYSSKTAAGSPFLRVKPTAGFGFLSALQSLPTMPGTGDKGVKRTESHRGSFPSSLGTEVQPINK